jgi:hypothetical protein
MTGFRFRKKYMDMYHSNILCMYVRKVLFVCADYKTCIKCLGYTSCLCTAIWVNSGVGFFLILLD